MIKIVAMKQIPYPPSEHSSQIVCGYINVTNLIQIVRITNIPDV